MKELKIEWSHEWALHDTRGNAEEVDTQFILPVVRLPDVDAVIAEAVWAMDLLQKQVAREFLGIKPLATPFGEELENLVRLINLLAAQRAKWLEEVRKKFFDNSMTDAQFAEWLCTQAQEQRP